MLKGIPGGRPVLRRGQVFRRSRAALARQRPHTFIEVFDLVLERLKRFRGVGLVCLDHRRAEIVLDVCVERIAYRIGDVRIADIGNRILGVGIGCRLERLRIVRIGEPEAKNVSLDLGLDLRKLR